MPVTAPGRVGPAATQKPRGSDTTSLPGSGAAARRGRALERQLCRPPHGSRGARCGVLRWRIIAFGTHGTGHEHFFNVLSRSSHDQIHRASPSSASTERRRFNANVGQGLKAWGHRFWYGGGVARADVVSCTSHGRATDSHWLTQSCSTCRNPTNRSMFIVGLFD